jgi:hypothetical protein
MTPPRSSVTTGNAGEHLVIAQLLLRGFHAGLADRGNPAFDIFTRHGNRQCGIRVKTSTHDQTRVTWSAKSDDELFLQMGENDYVALVLIPKMEIAHARFWIIPTPVVSETLKATHREWISIPKRDGSARKETKMRGLYLAGKPSYYRGYEQTWAPYEDAWAQLAEGV